MTLAVLVPLAAGSDGPATRGVIQWRSAPLATQLQDATGVATNLAAAARGPARHVVVQFDRPVAAGQHERLRSQGVTLLSYLGDNAFFAAVDPQRLDLPQLVQTPLRCVLPIRREWKLHPTLLSGQSLAAAYILFHPDVPVATSGVETCRRHGARVRSLLKSINAAVLELPPERAGELLLTLADEDGVQWIEPPLPPLGEANNDIRLRTGVNTVLSPPYGLDGSGVSVLVYDVGTALTTHADFGGRLHARDSSGLADHATHVAGTIGGSGSLSGGEFCGMAPAVTMQSYGFEQEGGLHQGFLYTDPGDLETDYHQAITTYGADIANNSLSTNTAANGFPCEWEGDYGVTDVLIDTIVRGDASNPLFTQPFRVVWANGNERGSGRCGTTYHTTPPPACAKNHIAVGAVYSNDDTATTFTSWGPADDGRLRPDLVAPGCQTNGDMGVTSCSFQGNYTVKCGTSMACPTVCGIAALLLQDFRQQYPGQPDFRNSTLKAILAQSAADLEAPGPDYKTGYGSVRAPAAVELLRDGNFAEGQVSHGEVWTATVIVYPDEVPLKVTLAWDDRPGTPNVSPALVNDIELRIFDAAANQYYPWTLDADNPAAPAVRTQADHVNNIEQIVIDDPNPGAFRLEVRGFNVPQGPQPFSVTGTPRLVICSSKGTAELDRTGYTCAATATAYVVDCDLNTSNTVLDTVTVMIASTSEPAGEAVLLTETAPDVAVFAGMLPLATTDAPGVLWIAPGDTVTLTYTDADNGSGQPAVVLDTALVDCTPPVISDVQITGVGSGSATVTFITDEPTRGAVRYGLSCAALNYTAQGSGPATAHSILLSALTPGTQCFLAVDATDAAGNTTTDDQGGDCYSLTTSEVPDYFTELFVNDNDLDYLTLEFTPNGSIDFYAACTNPITTLPTDPNGGAPVSLGEDTYVKVDLSGVSVCLYGVSYPTFYIGSNGYITFTAGDKAWTETLAQHFYMPRISALFDDLSPQTGGSVSWKQLADRVAVTWENVREYNTTNSNTFQIEMFFDGRIAMSYLSIAASDGLAGLSAGQGVPVDFVETDFSSLAACGPRPPLALDASVLTDYNQAVMITLLASDDGLPNPPGILTYVITALPEHGRLYDPGAAEITTAPYALVGNGNQVTYYPRAYYGGGDAFSFKANDGGAPPEGGDSNTALVSITVGGRQLVYDFTLETNPGWGTQGQWAFGQPTGAGSHNRDPNSGFTGSNVYGYNLSGDYTNNMPAYFLTTTAIDCSALQNVQLRFRRWLGVEDSDFDHAKIEVSSNGMDWTSVWQHSGAAVADTTWLPLTYDISAVADGQATVYLRWSMGPTDGVTTYPGWNIDDIEIWGANPPDPTGDMNCDFVVDFNDINGFVAALVSESEYYGYYPDCNHLHADCNHDALVDFNDISPFVALLTGDQERPAPRSPRSENSRHVLAPAEGGEVWRAPRRRAAFP